MEQVLNWNPNLLLREKDCNGRDLRERTTTGCAYGERGYIAAMGGVQRRISQKK